MSEFRVENHPGERTILLRLSGAFTEGLMRKFYREYRRVTDGYAGTPHLVLADFRGLKPMSPEVAEVLGEAIAYGRRGHAVRCALVCASPIVQLQAARIVRKGAMEPDATIDAATLEEAERALGEARGRLVAMPAAR